MQTDSQLQVGSWGERFALLDHYNPSDEEACRIFGLTSDELSTARDLRAAGTFAPDRKIDVSKFQAHFVIPSSTQTQVPNKIMNTNTSQPQAFTKPESATKKASAPKKRGRSGNKIQQAMLSITSTPMDAEAFMKEYNISIHVLKQLNNRFSKQHGEDLAAQVGKINVRQDKTSKKLMVWKS